MTQPTAPTTPLKVLRAAQDLIRDPSRWTQGAYVRHRISSRPTDSADSAGDRDVCRCALGAIYGVRGAPKRTQLRAQQLLNSASQELFERSVVSVNDTIYQAFYERETGAVVPDPRAHALVMRVYDRAVKMAAGLGLAGVQR